MSAPVLVIGYGNDLRRDDGLGLRLAAEIAARAWPGVRVLQLPQLLPELAEPLAECRWAIFVDARCATLETPIAVQSLTPAGDIPETHVSNPAGLLALARDLFGRAAPAWWVTVAGWDFGWGEGLSPEAERLVPEAVSRIERLALGVAEASCTNSG